MKELIIMSDAEGKCCFVVSVDVARCDRDTWSREHQTQRTKGCNVVSCELWCGEVHPPTIRGHSRAHFVYMMCSFPKARNLIIKSNTIIKISKKLPKTNPEVWNLEFISGLRPVRASQEDVGQRHNSRDGWEASAHAPPLHLGSCNDARYLVKHLRHNF